MYFIIRMVKALIVIVLVSSVFWSLIPESEASPLLTTVLCNPNTCVSPYLSHLYFDSHPPGKL